MVLEAFRAAEHLNREAGISCEIIDLHSSSHPQKEIILQSLKKTRKLIVADTSWQAYGVAAEVCRWVLEEDSALLDAPAKTIGMAPSPCPTAKSLEDIYYPNLSTLSNDIAIMVTGNTNHGISLPSENSMADVYKKFKGPF
jgi:pyruvate dehydrogenase E1 component beta subunit